MWHNCLQTINWKVSIKIDFQTISKYKPWTWSWDRDHYNAFAFAVLHSEGDLDAFMKCFQYMSSKDHGLQCSCSYSFSIHIFNFQIYFQHLTSKVSGWVSMISRKTRWDQLPHTQVDVLQVGKPIYAQSCPFQSSALCYSGSSATIKNANQPIRAAHTSYLSFFYTGKIFGI